MDLSKIPEPSEEDAEFIQTLEYDECEMKSSRAFFRVIAHLLRHGRALASAVKELDGKCSDEWGEDTYLSDVHRAAISFFEKFGGE